MAEVEEVSDRVIFINKGKVIADDIPENLAKSIKTSHVELLINDGFKKTIELCKEMHVSYKIQGRHIIVDVKEKSIPEFLRYLTNRKIHYDEISIEKPTLEDYFLYVANKTRL
jgi:ABC-2 type transport system ATP-binding protein